MKCAISGRRAACSLVAHIAANEDPISSSPLGEAIQSNPNARLLVCHSSQATDCPTGHGLLRAGMAEQRSFPSASVDRGVCLAGQGDARCACARPGFRAAQQGAADTGKKEAHECPSQPDGALAMH